MVHTGSMSELTWIWVLVEVWYIIEPGSSLAYLDIWWVIGYMCILLNWPSVYLTGGPHCLYWEAWVCFWCCFKSASEQWRGKNIAVRLMCSYLVYAWILHGKSLGVYWVNDLDTQVYRSTVEPIVPTIFNRTKATCFAYGQTGIAALNFENSFAALSHLCDAFWRPSCVTCSSLT